MVRPLSVSWCGESPITQAASKQGQPEKAAYGATVSS